LLGDLLRSMAEAPQVLGLDPAGDCAQFAARLREACCSAHLPGDQRQRSGVQVLDLAQAGLDTYQVVVVCGLCDGQFPAPRRPDVIYADASRQQLQQALPGLRPRSGQQEEDAYLLYGALAVAQQQLWLSYPQTAADGSPVLRSMYVDEVLRHWSTPTEDPLPSELLSRRRQSDVIVTLAEAAHYLEALEAVGDFRYPASPAALAAVQALAPPPGLPTAAQVQDLAQMEARRTEQPENSTYGGWLRQPEILAQLNRDFGPERIFSVSQLNTYGGCPMRYYLSRVLGLEAPAEPSEGLDRRDIGTLVHRVLALFFGQRTVGSDTCEPLTPDNLAAAQQALRECVEQVSNTWSAEVFGAPAVWERTIQRVQDDLLALLEYEANQYSPSAPTVVQAVEVSFGARGSFALALPDGETLKLRGRLDRLDLMDLTEAGEQRWVIWDYKTNDGSSARMIAEALDLQLAVYALAVEQVLYPGQAAGSQQWGYYRAARPVGWGSRLQRKETPGEPDNLEHAMQTAREKIAAYVGALRQGDFPAQPNEMLSPCRYCDFREICRVQVR
jgi:ATP-dependent helicase/nuclease subunit B